MVKIYIEINPACKGFGISLLRTAFMAGIFAFLLKIMHEENGNTMGRRIKRTYAFETVKRFTLFIYFWPDPFDAGFCKRDEIKPCKEQFREVLLGIITIVSNDLCCVHTQC